MSKSLHLTKKSANWRKRKFLERRKAQINKAKEHDALGVLMKDQFDPTDYYDNLLPWDDERLDCDAEL